MKNRLVLVLQILEQFCLKSRNANTLHGGPENLAQNFLYTLTLPNINQFSKLLHCQNQEKISNNTITKDHTTPQVCRYTTL